jgi:hypothetical protein
MPHFRRAAFEWGRVLLHLTHSRHIRMPFQPYSTVCHTEVLLVLFSTNLIGVSAEGRYFELGGQFGGRLAYRELHK